MGMRNVRLIIAYDGSRYHGWQRQSNAVTIQEAVETKLQVMVGEPVKLIASGRTDAGVHALNQVCNLKTRSKIGPETIKKGLNSLLPDDIFIREAEYVPLEFHARYSVKSKVYEYRVLNQVDPDIFLRNYLWHVRSSLDSKVMSKCLSLLMGRKDFSSFKSSGSGNMDPVRLLSRAELHEPEDGLLRFVIEADGFLRHMVRNIVGSVVEAGLGRISFDGFREILESRDRRLAGAKAPAQGLFLIEVKY